MLAPDDVVDANDVYLCIQFRKTKMGIAGPAIRHPRWVIRALRTLAEWWHPQGIEPTVKAPAGVTNLTTADIAIVLFKNCELVVPPGEVFADGIASYQIAVVGTQVDDQEQCVMRLLALAEQIQREVEKENGRE